jgi:hypothetical protein
MTRRRTPSRIARTWPATFGLCWILWLILGGSVARSEVLAGAGVAALAATIFALASAGAPASRPAVADLAALLRALGTVPADHVRLVRHLVRELAGGRSQGGYELHRFEAGPDGDERAVARRALAPVSASLSPNRYAIAADDETGVMLVHRLSGPPRGEAA